MPQKCFFKPIRTKQRRYSARDAARITCYATRAGASKAQIDTLYAEICKQPSQRRSNSAAAEALELAASNIQSNSDELRDAFQLFQVVNGLISLIFTLVPVLRLPSAIARLFSRSNSLPNGLVAAKMDVIQAQLARNDQAFRIVQQAAANEREFLLRSGANFRQGSF